MKKLIPTLLALIMALTACTATASNTDKPAEVTSGTTAMLLAGTAATTTVLDVNPQQEVTTIVSDKQTVTSEQTEATIETNKSTEGAEVSAVDSFVAETTQEDETTSVTKQVTLTETSKATEVLATTEVPTTTETATSEPQPTVTTTTTSPKTTTQTTTQPITSQTSTVTTKPIETTVPTTQTTTSNPVTTQTTTAVQPTTSAPISTTAPVTSTHQFNMNDPNVKKYPIYATAKSPADLKAVNSTWKSAEEIVIALHNTDPDYMIDGEIAYNWRMKSVQEWVDNYLAVNGLTYKDKTDFEKTAIIKQIINDGKMEEFIGIWIPGFTFAETDKIAGGSCAPRADAVSFLMTALDFECFTTIQCVTSGSHAMNAYWDSTVCAVRFLDADPGYGMWNLFVDELNTAGYTLWKYGD